MLHSLAITPVVVNTYGVNVACSTSITLLAYMRFSSFEQERVTLTLKRVALVIGIILRTVFVLGQLVSRVKIKNILRKTSGLLLAWKLFGIEVSPQ